MAAHNFTSIFRGGGGGIINSFVGTGNVVSGNVVQTVGRGPFFAQSGAPGVTLVNGKPYRHSGQCQVTVEWVDEKGTHSDTVMLGPEQPRLQVTVQGDARSVEVHHGDLKIDGAVQGDASSNHGSMVVGGDVHGAVDVNHGNARVEKDVQSRVQAHHGNIRARDIWGGASAQHGNVQADGDIVKTKYRTTRDRSRSP